MIKQRFGILLIMICCYFGLATIASADSASHSVADMIIKFAKHTSWRRTPFAGVKIFTVCVLQSPKVYISLMGFSEATVQQRKINIRSIIDVIQARQCQIIYADEEGSEDIIQSRWDLNKAGTLTISEAPNFVKAGGMIQIEKGLDGNGFSINLRAVHNANLIIDNALLRVADNVLRK